MSSRLVSPSSLHNSRLYLAPIIIPVGDVLTYDWAVPFPPGTLYEICMFDKNGHTGGCQAAYTVTSPTTEPTCANVTLPPFLSVDAQVNNGPMSRYGWIEQCSDISVTPKNGTPPYTLTVCSRLPLHRSHQHITRHIVQVAPSLHPPYNITSSDMKSINWTVTLSWASPFFISVVDSAGNMWANGLLHSGSGSNTACLSGGTAQAMSPHMVKPVIAIGAGAGGLGLGLLILVVVLFCQRHRRHLKKRYVDRDPPTTPGALSTQQTPAASRNLRNNLLGTTNRLPTYNIEPFIMPGEEEPLSRESGSPLPSATGRTLSSDNSFGAQNQIYVVHHDSQAPPVTIYHEDGTRVVELPPRYPASGSGRSEGANETRAGRRSTSDSKSDGERADVTATATQRILREHRRPNVSKKSLGGEVD
ncbi:uncharacterized protein LACBIDRAFT_298408 [Laccaria bicolor S238N-H82]|uniref:Predicted protein n=1 Tax=Laccaria bicolor (strain S238N-H82 / ATCC MYA-4686) TaxID=486041 RepID=B0DCS7_LACBS|nr:uncharacterized protein LACBIDRAFT_298408 [Laccaria bicolor S238N-H82]EDR07343.1 predicted protein [Laccaria bicolor S238N-H82]|eukprot:XP_001881735.1 predicted protein [Laccaria bicolor S238N-H82]